MASSDPTDNSIQDVDADSSSVSVCRVIAVALPLLVIGAVIVEFIEVYKQASGVSSGTPPAGAMGMFIPILLAAAAIPTLRRRWAITRGELIIVFSILALGIPIYGSGLWHHLAPLQIEYHRTRNLDRAMSISPNLWPNRGNILESASAEDPPVPGVRWTFSNLETTSITDSPDGTGRCVTIVHSGPNHVSQVMLDLEDIQIRPFVRPLVRYAVWARLRLDAPDPSSSAALWAGIGPNQGYELTSLRTATKPGLLSPDRFMILGRIDYQIPRNLEDRFSIRLTFSGRGTLRVKDVSVIDTEEIYRFHEGYEDAGPATYETLSQPQQSLTRLRPEPKSLGAWAKHLLFGLAPWRAWARPYLIWGLLIAGVFLGMFCLVTIFFRQWDRGDRLAFPLQTFILDLTRADPRGRLEFLRSRPFWVGFLVCAIHLSLQQTNRYVPDLPMIQTKLQIDELLPPGVLRDALSAGPYFPKIQIDIRPLYVAVAFFMSLEISLSLVVFFAFNCAYRFMFFFTPLKTLKVAGTYREYGYPFQRIWAAGGLVFLAAFCLFAARKHLAQVAGKVFLGRPGLDDSNEAMSYRWATVGLVVTVGIFILFAHLAELNPVFVVVYLGICLLLALSAARIRAETGLPHEGIVIAYTPWIVIGFGTALVFGFREVTLTAQLFFLYVGTFLLSAPILAESMAAASRVGVPLRKLGRCLLVGFVVAVVVGGLVSMSWSYTVGALNMKLAMAEKRNLYNKMTFLIEGDDRMIEQHFRDHPDQDPLVTPKVADEIGGLKPVTLIFVGISFGIGCLLALVRVIWLGFPLHPLGFALAFTPAINALWSSIAVAYLTKSLALRFGGVHLVRQVLRPFFVGVFVSELLMVILWSVIDATTQIAVG